MSAQQLVEALIAKNMVVTTAESCTGGLIAAAITDIAGSSAVFRQGIVAYANEVKTELLGVEPATIQLHGAVSEAVAIAMAIGARMQTKADIAIAVTGIAGPSGGTAEKPVGLVFIAISTAHGTEAKQYNFLGNRACVRKQTVDASITMVISILNKISGFA